MSMVKIRDYRLIREDRLNGFLMGSMHPYGDNKGYRLIREDKLDELIIINKLGSLPPELLEENVTLFNRVMEQIQKDIAAIAEESETLTEFKERVGLYVKVNPLTTSNNQSTLFDAIKGVSDVYNGQIGSGMTKTAELAGEVVRNDSLLSMTNLAEDIQSSIRNTLEKGLNNNKSMESIRDEMHNNIDSMTRNRAEKIARTETANAYNQAERVKAEDAGKEYFIVVSTPTCCEDCYEAYDGNVFVLPDDIDMIPPFHPNCFCNAVFFRTDSQAGVMADELSKERPDLLINQ